MKKVRRKDLSKGIRTKHLSVRVPECVLEGINLLIDLGFFKDKSDFINYALQESLKGYLMNIKLNLTQDVIDKYLKVLDKISPNLPEQEAVKLVKEIRNEQRKARTQQS